MNTCIAFAKRRVDHCRVNRAYRAVGLSSCMSHAPIIYAVCRVHRGSDSTQAAFMSMPARCYDDTMMTRAHRSYLLADCYNDHRLSCISRIRLWNRFDISPRDGETRLRPLCAKEATVLIPKPTSVKLLSTFPNEESISDGTFAVAVLSSFHCSKRLGFDTCKAAESLRR